MRDTMPRDGGAGVVSDEVKIDILAYILSRNDVPAGKDELKLAVKRSKASRSRRRASGTASTPPRRPSAGRPIS